MANRDESLGMEPAGKKHGSVSGQNVARRDATESIVRRVLNTQPSELFEQLRFQEAAIDNARAFIFDQYRLRGGFTLGKCRDHLHFLYLTHQLRRSDAELKDMAIVDHDLRLSKPHIRDIYLPGISDYSPEELFRPIEARGYAASFVHPAFLENPPAQPEPTYPTWKRWLCDYLGVRSEIRLLSQTGDSLAESFLYVAEHRKDKFLGMLESIWGMQGRFLADKPALKQMVGQISVPCASGAIRRLWETYLPLDKLQSYCKLFLEDGEQFPFLDLGEPAAEEELMGKWSFLCTDFAVSADGDIGFLLDVLGVIKEGNSQGLSVSRFRNLVRLYHDIEVKCLESGDPKSVQDIVWTYVADINGIAIPEIPGYPPSWVGPLDCLWNAPLGMTTKIPVEAIYATALQCSPDDLTPLSGFFQQTLYVPIMSWSDLTAELSSLQNHGSQDETHIARIHELIRSLATSDNSGELSYSGALAHG